MSSATATVPAAASAFRDLVLPREHGSWSLAFEPVALGLLVAPSVGGAWFALAVAAAFFARRPLNIALRDHRPARRARARGAVLACAAIAAACLLGAVAAGGTAWTAWLIPSALAGAVFVCFDVRNGGREEAAEIAGAAAFALLPAGFAAIAGEAPLAALAPALVMVGRAVPTVLCVRAFVRGAKTGAPQAFVAVAASALALGSAIALVRANLAPSGAILLFGLLLLRALALLVFPRPAMRARTLGMIEAATGVVFVFAVAALWRG